MNAKNIHKTMRAIMIMVFMVTFSLISSSTDDRPYTIIRRTGAQAGLLSDIRKQPARHTCTVHSRTCEFPFRLTRLGLWGEGVLRQSIRIWYSCRTRVCFSEFSRRSSSLLSWNIQVFATVGRMSFDLYVETPE